MNKLIIIPVVTAIFLVIDYYVWQAVKVSVQNFSQSIQQSARYIFWGLTTLSLVGLWLYNFTNPDLLGKTIRTWIMVGIFMNYLSKIFVVLFLLIDDIGRLIRWIVQKVQMLTNSTPANATATSQGEPITRSEFLMKTAF